VWDRRALSLAAGAFGVFCVLSLAAAFSAGATLDAVSGVWLSLAVDLSNGTFYRPLVADSGLGGTRYFPLTFVLHALLIGAGLSPIAAGRLLQVAAALTTVWAAWRILCELDVPPMLARPLALLTLCSTSAMYALTTIRGDLVPVALNMCGAAFAFRAFRRDTASDIFTALAFFVAAACAKVTALYSVVGIAAAFAINGKVRQAVQLAGGAAIGTLLALGLADWASSGRMMESFRACMFIGSGLQSARRAPLGAAYAMARQDALSVLLLTLFGASALIMPRQRWKDPIVCLTLSALAMVVVLYSSPGVDFNHLIDFYVVATLLAGYLMVHVPRFQSSTPPLVAAAVLLSIAGFYVDSRHAVVNPLATQLPKVRALLSTAGAAATPIFADTGVVPALVGETNYLVDPYMFGQLRARDDRYEAALLKAVDDRRFAFVILPSDDQRRLADLYGPRFSSSLTHGYAPAANLEPYFVYRRRP
jgi:hypothetical protein